MRTTLLLAALSASLQAAAPYPEKTPDTEGNRTLHAYFTARTAQQQQTGSLQHITTAEQWQKEAPQARQQLFHMLGLAPLPQRTPLQPVITSTLEQDGVRVEKLHFQSMPQLYVTANFYLPQQQPSQPLPTILYLCGHSVMKKDGVSYGNKAGYHHHGLWFAQHGYACLIIDTLQLGEIEGEHHGTHHLKKWWWVSRGYTPAGVEAWNGIRALDYLQTRPEVDSQRIGVTGRSGGGAYSWWVAALDDRIRVAAPTAGITTLHDHIVEGCIEGHCDCMFQLNTQGWEYDRVIALLAPRPLLICNTDKDSIFPISGVFTLYQSARRLYGLLGADAQLGLQVAEGPHKDTQPLNTGAFHWMERHLKGADIMVTTDAAAKKALEPQQLRVFQQLPPDQRNTRIDQDFVPLAQPPQLQSAGDWPTQRHTWLQALQQHVFPSWPSTTDAPAVKEVKTQSTAGITLTQHQITTQAPFTLPLYLAHRQGLKPEDIELCALHVLDEEGWAELQRTYASSFPTLFPSSQATPDADALKAEQSMMKSFKWAMAYLPPRGIGPSAWTGSEKAQTHRQRRFLLLGETWETGQVYDIRRSLQALRSLPGYQRTPLWLTGHRQQAVNALYASLFEPPVTRLDLHQLPTSHMQASAPAYPNVLRHLDLPQAVALAAEHSRVILYTAEEKAWQWPTSILQLLGKEKNLQLRQPQQP